MGGHTQDGLAHIELQRGCRRRGVLCLRTQAGSQAGQQHERPQERQQPSHAAPACAAKALTINTLA